MLKTDNNILYEYLKHEGFHPYMLEYLVDGLFINSKILSLTVPKEKQKQLYVSNIVQVDKIDKKFREKILNWILEIENSYKLLLSRISTNEVGGSIIAQKVVQDWANSNDPIKVSQYKRAKSRYKYLSSSDNFDYVQNDDIPLDDLMDQLDLSSLPDLLTRFDEHSKESIGENGERVKTLFPWIRDIVLHIGLLRDLRVLRNAAANGRPVIPAMVNPDFNPNWDMEFTNPLGRTKIEKWEVFEAFEQFHLEQLIPREIAVQMMQTIYENPYRKTWFELNFIYHRFICMFDVKRYNDFCIESDYFLDYSYRKVKKGHINERINPILVDMGDLTMFNLSNITPAYRTISNESEICKVFAQIHYSCMKYQTKRFL